MYLFKLSGEAQKNYEENLFEASILVCTYNSSEQALFATLDSIIAQEHLKFEIIITDDGSENDLHEEVFRYFAAKHFIKWTMICNNKNCGTVCDLNSGLKACKGKYIKIISPGDVLVKSTILKQWIEFLNKTNSRWGG